VRALRRAAEGARQHRGAGAHRAHPRAPARARGRRGADGIARSAGSSAGVAILIPTLIAGSWFLARATGGAGRGGVTGSRRRGGRRENTPATSRFMPPTSPSVGRLNTIPSYALLLPTPTGPSKGLSAVTARGDILEVASPLVHSVEVK